MAHGLDTLELIRDKRSLIENESLKWKNFRRKQKTGNAMDVKRTLRMKGWRRHRAALISVFILIASFGTAIGQTLAVDPPNIISYQGRILNAVGVPVADATAEMTFALYDGPDTGTDTCLWSNDNATCNAGAGPGAALTITLTDGLFSENLGDTSDLYAAISDSVFADQNTLYLAVAINGEDLTPLKRVTAQGFAINASLLDGLNSSATGGTTAFVPVTGTNGNLVLTGDPQGTGVSQGTLYVNPATPGANETLFGIANNGTLAFSVDAEGDASLSGTLVTDAISSDNNLTITAGGGELFINASQVEPTGVADLGDSTAGWDNIYIDVAGEDIGLEDITSATESGAFAIGVFDEFANSANDSVQEVLNDFDDVLANGGVGSLWTLDTGTVLLTNALNSFAIGGNVADASPFGVDTTSDIVYLGEDDADLISALGLFTTSLIPSVDDTSDLGSNTNRWKDLYVGGETIHIGTNLTDEGTISYDTTLNQLEIASTGSEFDIGSGAIHLSTGVVEFGTDIDFLPTLGAGSADIGSLATRWDNIFTTDANISGTLTAASITCTDCLDYTSFADALTLDATTVTDVGASNLQFTGSGSGDFIFNPDTDTNVQITASAAPGADLLAITDNGNASTTDGVDGLSVSINGLNESTNVLQLGGTYTGDGGDTFIVSNISGITVTTSAGTDTVAGFAIGSLTEAGAGSITSSAVSIGTGWDKILDSALDIASNGDISDDSGDVTIADDLSITGTTISAPSTTSFGCSDCINFDDLSDDLVMDASTSINIDGFNLSIGGAGSGDFIFNPDSDTNFQLIANTAPGVDMFSLTNSGQPSTTSGVDGLSLLFGVSNTSGSVIDVTPSYAGDGGDTYTAIAVNGFTANSSAGTDTVNGLAIGTLVETTPANTTSSALTIGTGWDKVLESALDIASDGSISDDSGDVTINDNLSINGTIINAPGVTSFGCADCINFDDFSDSPSLDNLLSVSQGGFSWNQDYGGTGGSGVSYSANSLTTGRAVAVTSSGGITSGGLLNLDHTATYSANATNSGNAFVVNRALTASGAATTLTLSGALAALTNTISAVGGATVTDSANILALTQSNTGSTGAVLSLTNAGAGNSVFIDSNDNGVALNIDSEATSANVATLDGSVLTGGNILKLIGGDFTDDTGRAIDIDVTESTATADIFKIQTNYVADTDVFRIEADGEAFSREGFTTGTTDGTTYSDGKLETTSSTYTINAGSGTGTIIGGANDSLRLGASPTAIEGSTTDSPAITFRGTYDNTSGGSVVTTDLDATIYHNLTGAVPSTSQLDFDIAGGLVEMDLTEVGDLTAIGGVSFGDTTNTDRFLFTSGAVNTDVMVFTDDTLVSADGLTMSVDTLDSGSGIFVQRANAGGSNYNGSSTDALVYIDQADTGAGTGDALKVSQSTSGTGSGVYIVQNTVGAPAANAIDNQALVIDVTEAASNDSVLRIRNNAGAETIFNINNRGGILMDGGITAGGATCGGCSFAFTSDSTTTNAMNLTFDLVTTGIGLDLSVDGLTDGSGLRVTRADSVDDYEGGANAALVFINQANNNPGSDGGALQVENMGGASVGVHIVQNTVDAPVFPSTAINNNALVIDVNQAADSNFVFLTRSNGGTDIEFVIENDGDYQYDGTGSTPAADVAEVYASRDALEPGDVVAIDPNGDLRIRKTTTPYEQGLFGAISTKPALRMGSGEIAPEYAYDVALTGRIPLKVTSENGAIAVGDLLTSSSTPGVAMKATETGAVVGIALESLASGEGVILAFIRSNYDIDTESASVAQNTASSTISSSLASLDMTGNVFMGGQQILSIGRLAGISNNWSVEEDGTFVTTKTYTAEAASTQGGTATITAVMSPEVTITLSGTTELHNGEATISFEQIDPSFNDVISTIAPIRVVVTANGPTGSLYVSEKDNNGFRVKESGRSSDDVSFDWLVIAYRNGFEPAEELIAPELPATEAAPENSTPIPSAEESVVEADPTTAEPAVESGDESTTEAEPVVESTDEDEPPTETVPEAEETEPSTNDVAETEAIPEEVAPQTEEPTPPTEVVEGEVLPETEDTSDTVSIEETPTEEPVQNEQTTIDPTATI